MTNSPIFYPEKFNIEQNFDDYKEKKPSGIKDVINAKLILQECSADTGDCLFDHISDIIKRVIDERPPNVIDYFEEYSREIRESQQFRRSDEPYLHDTYLEPSRLESARNIMNCLRVTINKKSNKTGGDDEEGEEEEEEEADPATKIKFDVLKLQYYWNLAGCGFLQHDVYLLASAIEKLKMNPIITTCRFWGKIIGLQKNYWIVEVKLSADEKEKRRELEKEQIVEETKKIKAMRKNLKEKQKIMPDTLIAKPVESLMSDVQKKKLRPRNPPLPHSFYKIPLELPAERTGSGVNRYTYFVCNSLCDEWIELPTIKPKHITVSRQMKKFLTGNLTQPIESYPEFPGNESHYLRTLITRITSGTYVSPAEFYTIDEEEEEEEEEEEDEDEIENNDKPVIFDEDYEAMSTADLLNSENWVHYRPYLLNQGRIKWKNPKKVKLGSTGEGEEEEEEEEEEEVEEEEEEEEEDDEARELERNGRELLSTCDEDTFPVPSESQEPWSIKLSQLSNSTNSIVVIKSNIWPGAISLIMNTVHDNLYIGWGHKYVHRNYTSIPIPPIEIEYPMGPEIMEMADATVDEEEAYRLAHEKKPKVESIGEGEGEGEQEEEEETVDETSTEGDADTETD